MLNHAGKAAFLAALIGLATTGTAAGQAAQDAPSEPTYPTLSLGTVSYIQYAVDLHDPDRLNAFDLTRGYIQIQAELDRRVSFRLTPDIRRASGTTNGSLEVRLKFGYLDFHTAGSGRWLRVGLHQTPWLDFQESINRYRAQGQMFAEREGIIPGSSDFGIGSLVRFGGQRVEIQGGIYNGEGFGSGDVDRGKSVQGRLTIRPFGGPARAFRLSAFGDFGSSSVTPDRRHAIAMASYESTRVVATIEYLRSRRPVQGLSVHSTGVSAYTELRRSAIGPAAFTRVEHLESDDQSRRRAIVGLAYWFKWDRVRLGSVASLEDVRSTLASTPEREQRLAAQMHVQF